MKEKEKKFNLAVKNNLRSFLKTKGYNVNEYGSFETKDGTSRRKYYNSAILCSALENKWLHEENVEAYSKIEDKLKKTLSDETNQADPFFINEICSLYDFPLHKIITTERVSPEDAEQIMEDIEKGNTKNFAPLSKEDSGTYFGKFYGYSFNHDPNETKKILEFELSIFEDENNNPKAEYSYITPYGYKTVFSGTPYYFSNLESISIEMTAENEKRYQYLYFHSKNYHSPLLHKVGVCVRTSTASSKREPDVKNFVITSFKLPDEYKNDLIPALLKMTDDFFYVTATQLSELRKDTQIEDFFINNKGAFSLIDGEVYSINEANILNSLERDEEDKKINSFYCLTKIKSVSLAPYKVTYLNSNSSFKFFRKLKAETEQFPTHN